MLISFALLGATAAATKAISAVTIAKMLIPIGTAIAAAQPIADSIKSR